MHYSTGGYWMRVLCAVLMGTGGRLGWSTGTPTGKQLAALGVDEFREEEASVDRTVR